MENNTKNKQRNWSDLPDDMLLLISSNLSSSFFDMLSLKSVCSSWRITMKNRPKISYPMLVSSKQTIDHGNYDSTMFNYDFSLLGISNEKRYKFNKSPWFVEQYKREHDLQKLPCMEKIGSLYKIVGSHPDGWVIFSDGNHVFLLHLFQKTRLELPNKMLNTNGRWKELNNIRKIILSTNDSTSPEDFNMVMIYGYCRRGIYSYSGKLAFLRHGYCNWTCFGDRDFYIYDIAFCNNALYTIRTGYNSERFLESWDFRSNLSLPVKKLCIELDGGGDPRLVVSSEDEIFLLTFHYAYKAVFKLDLSKKQFILLESLNGMALIWCLDVMVLVSASDVERLGYEENFVYFVVEENEEGEKEKHIKFSTYFYHRSKGSKVNQYLPEPLAPFGIFLLSI